MDLSALLATRPKRTKAEKIAAREAEIKRLEKTEGSGVLDLHRQEAARVDALEEVVEAGMEKILEVMARMDALEKKEQNGTSGPSGAVITEVNTMEIGDSMKTVYIAQLEGAKIDGGTAVLLNQDLSNWVKEASWNFRICKADVEAAKKSGKDLVPSGPSPKSYVEALDMSSNALKFCVGCKDPRFWAHFWGKSAFSRAANNIARTLGMGDDVDKVKTFLRAQMQA